jgi:AraC family transcriptional regulator
MFDLRLGSASRVRLATDYMRSNLDRALSLHELSQVSGLSPSHFRNVFKVTTGLSPHRYLTQARLDLAKDLLARRGAVIAQVGLEVGFSSQSHFTWAFHNRFGITPAAFQRSLAAD